MGAASDDMDHRDVVPGAPADASPTGAHPRKGSRRLQIGVLVLAVGLVIMLAGLSFGYDQGVISGALDGIQKRFSVGTFLLEIITSWVTLGAMIGALMAGAMADRIGRRWTIVVAALLFIGGALVESLAPSAVVLVAGRLFVGFGVGVASVAAPLYAAEMAPQQLRGRMVSLYQLAITIGIFAAYLADYLLTHANSWRAMLGISAIPGVLLVLVIIPLPDTPRWYMKKQRREVAATALRRLEPDCDVEANLTRMQEVIDADDTSKATWGEVFASQWRRPLVIGVVLALLQQFTGINAIIYYADKIFAAAGFESPTEQSLATLFAIGGVNVIATLVAVAWVDKLGRRPLMLAGSTGMCASLVVVGIMFLHMGKVTASTHASAPMSNDGLVTLVALVVFIASFAFSLGPVVWTIINEIYPSRIRSKAVAVATATNWLAAWLVSQFFLTLVATVSETGAFLIFAGFCIVTWGFVMKMVPETKGKSLEEVEAMWTHAGEADAAATSPTTG